MEKQLTKVVTAIMVLSALLAGGSATAAQRTDAGLCQYVPITTPGVSIVGKRVQQVSDVQVCIEAEANVQAGPAIREQPFCGTPCFTIEMDRASVSEDARIEITYALDGEAQTPLRFHPEGLDVAVFDGRMCLVGVGTPDPCIDRITQPTDVRGESSMRRVRLGWRAAQDTGGAPLTGYEVFRSTTGEEGTFESVGTVEEPIFVDRGLRRRTGYWYYVVAFDGDGNRSLASEVTAVRTR
ncbi:MAG TPA: fibronectin type III domain-containing protein [Actinomycetota bacterium]|nr:fibronectin type III domain-containing protein [Actinomycetota bacterium]